MSQKNLAAAVGVSFQQIQKNERGTNRIGASRMLELSRALDVPVSFFFDDMPPQPPIQAMLPRSADTEAAMEIAADVMASRETQELVEVYYAIPDQRARKRLLTFIRSIPATTRGR
jgi:transcriptional regulator with XRE-family HTH domain